MWVQGRRQQGGASKPSGVITGLDNIPWEFQGLSEGLQGVFPWGWGSSLPPVLGQGAGSWALPELGGHVRDGRQSYKNITLLKLFLFFEEYF